MKNRFGSTNEVGIFDMDEKGLKEVPNPSLYLISGKEKKSSGSLITPTVEGTRALMVEIQALVIPTRFSYPQRVARGFRERKLDLLMAVFQKRLMMDMSGYDVYCNIAGGMNVFEPSIDLGVILAILSSLLEKPISDDLCVVGEVGLSGEVRAVPFVTSRIKEASKIGFKKIVVPYKAGNSKADIEVLKVSNVSQAKEICKL
jgi:DNA repair protein RadA/Sms